MKVYIVIELKKCEAPKIIDVMRDKTQAQALASLGESWRNVIEWDIK